MAVRYWFGSLLLAFGVLLFMDQFAPALGLGVWISRLWPSAVILLGVILLLARSTTWIGGMIVLFIGILMQVAALGFWSDRIWGLVWPAFLIFLGILVVFRLGRPAAAGISSEDVLNQFVVFSGSDIRPRSANFRGGSVVAAFGGMDVDLREAQLSKEGAWLEVTAAFGGIDVVLPGSWRVNVDGFPFFGAWSNKTTLSAPAEGPVLNIRCLAMFGGIEIKN